MQPITTTTKEPSLEELTIVETLNNLRWLAEHYSWDFDLAISDIEFLRDAHLPTPLQLTREQEIELENERLEALSDQAHDAYLAEVQS